jgi:hypothetical protein
MQFPIATGSAARLLGVTEPRLAEQVRRGRIRPEPLVIAGRRLWEATHLIQAAENLGLVTDDLRRRLGQEAVHAP